MADCSKLLKENSDKLDSNLTQEEQRQVIDDVIAELKQEQSVIETKIQDQHTGIGKELTTPDKENDPGNHIRNTYRVGKIKNNILHQVSNFTAYLKDKIKTKSLSDLTSVFTDKYPVTQESANLLNDLVQFNEKFSKSLNTILKIKTDKQLAYRYQDHMQYLIQDGKIPQNVVDAIASASYEWVASKGENTFLNDEATIKKILNLRDSDQLPKNAEDWLSHVGSNQNALVDALGEASLKLLGIEPTDTSQSKARAKLVTSLGLMSLSTLQHMNVLIQKKVFTGGVTEKSKQKPNQRGLGFLADGGRLDTPHKLYAMSPQQYATYLKKTGNYTKAQINRHTNTYREHQTTTFYKLNDMATNAPSLFRKAKDTISRVFTGENNPEEYSWDKPKPLPKNHRYKIQGTNDYATPKQTINLHKSESEPWVASNTGMNSFFFLDHDQQKQIMGQLSKKHKHISNEKSVDGVNLGIKREYDAIMAWIADARTKELGTNTPFYIRAKIARNMRMHQIGSINPQGSKVHRYLFALKDWMTLEWNPNGYKNNRIMNRKFMEAVGLSLGVESGKKGGLDKAIAATEARLQEPAIAAAVEALRMLDANMRMTSWNDEQLIGIKKMFPDISNDITAGVIAGGEKVHTLKGLTEYARFLNAKDTRELFQTDLPTEIDGVSNGPIIGRIQFISDEADKSKVLSTVNNGGLALTPTENRLDERLNSKHTLDTYEAMGHQWALEISKLSLTAAQDKNSKQLKEIEAINSLFGSFTDENGYVQGLIRALSKQPTMTTIYGVGRTKLIENFAESATIQDNIYGKLEKIYEINKTDPDAALDQLNQLVNAVHEITGNKSFGSKLDLTKPVYGSQLLALELSDADYNTIVFKVTNLHGKALHDAVKEVYGDIMDTREPFNKGIAVSAAMYNTIYHLKRDAILGLRIEKARKKAAEVAKDFKDPEAYIAKEIAKVDLTVKEHQEIIDSIAYMYPKIRTPFGGKLSIVKASSEVRYNSIPAVEQKYNKGMRTKKGYLKEDQALANPGVSPAVVGTHMQDATVANLSLGNIHAALLNNHDGFGTGINKATSTAENLNKDFQWVMETYDFGSELENTFTRTKEAFLKELDKFGVPDLRETSHALDLFILEMDKFKLLYDNASNEGELKYTHPSVAIESYAIEIKRLAQETKTNKKLLLDAVQYYAQYSYTGFGSKTDNEFQSSVYGISTTTYKDVEVSGVKETAGEIVSNEQATEDLVKQHSLGSSPNSSNDISEDINDYPDPEFVDNQNVTQIYHNLKNLSNISDSKSHDNYLTQLLDKMVAKVMAPVNVYLQSNPNIEAKGRYNTKGQIFISSQTGTAPKSGILAQGIRMSTGEVYAHEMVHHVTEHGLSTSIRLRNQAIRLAKLAEKHLDYTAFLNDPNINVNDQAHQYEVQAAKDRWNYIFESPDQHIIKDPDTGKIRKYSSKLSEFVALGTTNENFMKALGDLDFNNSKRKVLSKDGLGGKSLQEQIVNLFNRIMDLVQFNFSKKKPSSNVGQELQNLALRLAEFDSKEKTRLSHFLDVAENKYSTTADYANKHIKNFMEAWPIKHIGSNLKQQGRKLKEADNGVGFYIRKVINRNQTTSYGLLESIRTEMKGSTERLQPLHDILSKRGVILDSEKEAAAANIVKVANSQHKRELTSDEKIAYTKIALKTDLDALRVASGLENVSGYLRDETLLNARIDSLKQDINSDPALRGLKHFYYKASKALGKFMVTGKGTHGVITLQNTHVIANMPNRTKKANLTKDQAIKAENILDQLASLYALKNTPTDQRATMAALIKEDQTAVDAIMALHRNIKTQALESSFDNNPNKFMKGYTHQILNPRIEVTQGLRSDQARYEKLGYSMMKTPIKRDIHDRVSDDIMMFKSTVGSVNDYQSAILSITGNRARGTNSMGIQGQLGGTAQQGDINRQAILARKAKVLDDMYLPGTPNPPSRPSNEMIPQVDDQGLIRDYRYMMDEHTKDTLLEQHNEFDALLGAMAAQIIDKANTPIINNELVHALKTLYNKEFTDNPGSYVEISPFALEKRHRDIYHMMPASTKQTVKKIWGEDKMYVSKDVVDLAFGQRKYTIKEMYGKTKAERNMYENLFIQLTKIISASINKFYDKDIAPIKVAKTLEETLIETTKLAKSNIIIRNFVVTRGNFASNMVYLKMKGVSNRDILKNVQKASISAIKYQADTQALDELKAQKNIVLQQSVGGKTPQTKTINRIDKQIADLENEIALNPSTKLIESGLMPSIVDDVETANIQSPYMSDVEAAVTKQIDRLPGVVKKVGNVAFMTESSTGYKILNNAVKMTDYVGRYVLYQEYVGNQNMSHEDAVAAVIEEFINFDLPTHKILEYGNNIGLIWFSKYQLRILKQIGRVIADKPFESISTFLLASAFGVSNIFNSVPGITKDVSVAFGDPVSSLIDSVDEISSIDMADDFIY